MTFVRWWAQIRRHLSGRAAYEDRLKPPEVPEIALPDIGEPVSHAHTHNGHEKEYLERQLREHEERLHMLRVKADVWSRHHDS